MFSSFMTTYSADQKDEQKFGNRHACQERMQCWLNEYSRFGPHK